MTEFITRRCSADESIIYIYTYIIEKKGKQIIKL